jgi:putative phosphoesterase
MHVAALYDIHGNLPALEAVLDELRRTPVDRIVVGGDVVVGPMSGDALDRLLAVDVPVDFIYGNCETAVLAQRAGAEPGRLPPQVLDAIRWEAAHLRTDHAHFLTGWPKTLRLEVDGVGRVLFCHGTPRDENEIFSRLTSDDRVRSILDAVDADVVVCGHTHMQFDRTVGAIRVVNAGSVGMPFGATGAHWLLLGPDVQLQRTPYDLSNAADRIRRTSYPQADDFVAHYLLQPPSESQMLEAFAKAETT